MQNYLTLRQAAVLAGLSPRRGYELCRVGAIRARVVRGPWRVHRRDIALLGHERSRHAHNVNGAATEPPRRAVGAPTAPYSPETRHASRRSRARSMVASASASRS
jgi:hypothetical protein